MTDQENTDGGLLNSEPAAATVTPAKSTKGRKPAAAKPPEGPPAAEDAAPVDAEGPKPETVAELRERLAKAFPGADPATMLHQMQRGQAKFSPRIQNDDKHTLGLSIDVTPSTIGWLAEVLSSLWPSRRPRT